MDNEEVIKKKKRKKKHAQTDANWELLPANETGCWINNHMDVMIPVSLHIFARSSLLSYFGKFSLFSFTFLSPCLSHKRLLSLHALLRLPAFNVWNDPLVWSVLVTVWLWYSLFNWIFLNVMFPLIYFIFYSVTLSFSSWCLWSLFSLVCKKQTYCTMSLGELMLQDTQSC